MERNRDRRFPPEDDPKWAALINFVNRPYFEHTWIMQETSHAEKAWAMVGFGELRIAGNVIGIAANWFNIKGYQGLIPGLTRLSNVLYIWRAKGPYRPPLLNRLLIVRNFKATNPRDKIYALLGISLEGRKLASYQRLRIDDKRDFVDVYRDAVQHFLENPNPDSGKYYRLRVLSLVQYREEESTDQRPSWGPARPEQAESELAARLANVRSANFQCIE